jgi:8-oxo-dGTP pyrophosphatase MutT (NUDIX family)
MVAGSILPIAIHKNQMYFLFGKENPLEDSAKGWSDFGGGCDSGETPFETALREGSEELTGFLGDSTLLRKKVRNPYKMVHNDYHMFLFRMEYDEKLPIYYNLNHAFLWKKMDHQVLSKTNLFEKIEIQWFTIQDMKKYRHLFRKFYRDMVDKIIEEEQLIRKHFKKYTMKRG